MPQLQTTYFELLEYAPESVFDFPSGIPGFEQEKQFLFVQQPASRPLVFMQSMTQPGLCFLALPVQIVQPEYRLRMNNEDLQAIGLPGDRQPEIGAQVLCLALLSLADQQPPTANLLSPIVVNLQARKAVQAIQYDVDYSHCHALAPVAKEVLCS